MSSKINISRKVPLLDRGLFFLSFTVPYIQQQQYYMALIITSCCILFPLRKLHKHSITNNAFFATATPSTRSLSAWQACWLVPAVVTFVRTHWDHRLASHICKEAFSCKRNSFNVVSRLHSMQSPIIELSTAVLTGLNSDYLKNPQMAHIISFTAEKLASVFKFSFMSLHFQTSID